MKTKKFWQVEQVEILSETKATKLWCDIQEQNITFTDQAKESSETKVCEIVF